MISPALSKFCPHYWAGIESFYFGCLQYWKSITPSIEPAETKWGLTNVRPHAVMHCSCDERSSFYFNLEFLSLFATFGRYKFAFHRFRNCLKLVRTQAADLVGNLFFNVINIPCFVFSQEPVCTSRNWWGRWVEALWRRHLVNLVPGQVHPQGGEAGRHLEEAPALLEQKCLRLNNSMMANFVI